MTFIFIAYNVSQNPVRPVLLHGRRPACKSRRRDIFGHAGSKPVFWGAQMPRARPGIAARMRRRRNPDRPQRRWRCVSAGMACRLQATVFPFNCYIFFSYKRRGNINNLRCAHRADFGSVAFVKRLDFTPFLTFPFIVRHRRGWRSRCASARMWNSVLLLQNSRELSKRYFAEPHRFLAWQAFPAYRRRPANS
ncbi:hypothetical protein FB597_108154 [Herbaspirillum sp. SJZ099]|nr:hypothetical protein FB597_108154 [Herbaspirillum sp. SJZ099]